MSTPVNGVPSRDTFGGIRPAEHPRIWSLLHTAAYRGDAAAIPVFAANIDVNARDRHGMTPLHVAVVRDRDHGQTVAALLAAGADVNARAGNGCTSLWAAIEYGRAAALQLLIATGADVNIKAPDGSTPLHWAAFNDAPEAIWALLAAGARVNESNTRGETPLDVVKDAECRELLAEALAKAALG